jgi:hypothetical protein
MTHLQYLIIHPDKFNLTTIDLRVIYRSANEQYGIQGVASNKIVEMLKIAGWLIVEKTNNTWNIHSENKEKLKAEIGSFIFWAVENGFIKGDDPLFVMDRYGKYWYKNNIDIVVEYLQEIYFENKPFIIESENKVKDLHQRWRLGICEPLKAVLL